MKIAFFSAKAYDKTYFNQSNQAYGFELVYFENALQPSYVNLIPAGTEAICAFVNDQLGAQVLGELASKGVRILALRCAGFNNVDLKAAEALGLVVCRVPAYSPEAVAEHTMAMLLTINRKTHKAYNRVREQNFSLDGLIGFNLHGKTVGVIGTGKIGKAFIRILNGFGCRVLAFDPFPDPAIESGQVSYVDLENLFRESDVVSLHCPLTPENHYLIQEKTLSLMKRGVVLVNTSRGGLLNTTDVIAALKTKRVGALCIDVYEQEEKLFFRDLSSNIIEDDTIQRLMSFPNVLITAHQAFLTEEALTEIAGVTLRNIADWQAGKLESGSVTRLV
jgi:D-lactate dehydrogenase